jgi:hypothetical protein
VLTDTNEEYLFDLRADPGELVNLINDPGSIAVRDDLRDELRGWMIEIGDRAFPN